MTGQQQHSSNDAKMYFRTKDSSTFTSIIHSQAGISLYALHARFLNPLPDNPIQATFKALEMALPIRMDAKNNTQYSKLGKGVKKRNYHRQDPVATRPLSKAAGWTTRATLIHAALYLPYAVDRRKDPVSATFEKCHNWDMPRC